MWYRATGMVKQCSVGYPVDYYSNDMEKCRLHIPYLYAGISGINPEYYEAAAIDGAGVFQRIFHVTLPCILSLGKTMLILQVISVFQILYEPLVLTNGGPNNASLSIMLLVYQYAFTEFNYPCAAALSVMICIVLILLSGLYMYLTRKKDD